MGHNDELFSPESIDEQIEQHRLGQSLPAPDEQIIHDLHRLAHAEQSLDHYSLERVWQQLQTRREHATITPQNSQHTPQTPWKRLARKTGGSKEETTMGSHNMQWGKYPATPLVRTKQRNSIIRTVSLGLVAAIALITILSFTVFSGLLRPAILLTHTMPATLTGTQHHTISNGKLVCGIRAQTFPQIGAWVSDLSWSSQGLIAVANSTTVQAYTANNCSQAFSKSLPAQNVAVFWSPDGKKLAVNDTGRTYVLDTHGNVIAQNASSNCIWDRCSWSADSTKLIFQSANPTRIASQDMSSGNKITTLLSLPTSSIALQFSPGLKLALVGNIRRTANNEKKMDFAIWDIKSGRKISTLALGSNAGSLLDQWAFSPDGSQIAVSTVDDSQNKIQIFDTVSGKLLITLDSQVGDRHTISWSPDGKYIADGSDAIRIYDVKTNKLVATFGQVGNKQWVTKLAWSPDSTELAATTRTVIDPVKDTYTINVWRLS